MSENLSFDFWGKIPRFKKKIIQNVIIDRGSKYSAVWGLVESKEEVEKFMKELLTDKYFQDADHNSYAFRIKLENGSILEWKNDDWETWAGLCILRELQRESAINTIVVVTRIFGWTLLYADRFKNVIDASKIILKEI